MLPLIASVRGPDLSADERAFLHDAQPAGVILFNRNIVSHEQVRRLTAAISDALGRNRVPILIDQEGGRVQMLRRGPSVLLPDFADLIGRNDNPCFPEFPEARRFGDLGARNSDAARAAARANGRAIGALLADLGITVACAPVLDLPAQDAHDVIGDRAFSADPDLTAALGGEMVDGLMEAGVASVIKHIPGHGRAHADSHRELPVVNATRAELELDLAPFRALARSPWAMTAHILYPVIDPDHPATQSSTVIAGIIRGSCGFGGVLVTDAIEMQALAGDLPERAARSVAAGCDLALYCSGKLPDMLRIAAALTPMEAEAAARIDASLPRASATLDFDALIADRDRLLIARG